MPIRNIYKMRICLLFNLKIKLYGTKQMRIENDYCHFIIWVVENNNPDTESFFQEQIKKSESVKTQYEFSNTQMRYMNFDYTGNCTNSGIRSKFRISLNWTNKKIKNRISAVYVRRQSISCSIYLDCKNFIFYILLRWSECIWIFRIKSR